MKHLCAIAVLVLSPSVTVHAQDSPRAELYGGYSYVHQYRQNFNGWSASGSVFLNRAIGVEANVGGYYHDTDAILPPEPPIRDVPLSIKSDFHTYSFLFGPHVTYRTNRVAPYFHTLFGVAHTSLDTISNPQITVFGTQGGETNFAMALGGGVDLKLNRKISLRLVEADYYRAHYGTFAGENGVRLSFGLVFTLGST